MDSDSVLASVEAYSNSEPPYKRKKFCEATLQCDSSRNSQVCLNRESVFHSLIKERWKGSQYMQAWDQHSRSLYSSLACVSKYDPLDGSVSHGAVFNLEFSPDGDFVVAACEKLDVVVFDPISHRKVSVIPRAHEDCVNCVTFLDTRTFATCSDDATVSLWDIRNVKNRIMTLVGHSSWVKSISYNGLTRQLVTSAFDDTVRSWDINKYSVDGIVRSKKILRIQYLTRTKLSPDCSKMLVATTTGMIVVVHDLDLDKLKTDWRFTRPNDIQTEQAKIHAKRNRIEYLSHFPVDGNPWCVSSLHVHPFGWNVLSRYTSQGSRTEWTTVHDIQPFHEGDCSDSCRHRRSRLIGYIEEANSARGYIKEHCYSGDGRVICSPFANGVRLLAFNRNCDELSRCEPPSPREFEEVCGCTAHKHAVLTTRFSPNIPLLATGCLGGQVAFYQPRF